MFEIILSYFVLFIIIFLFLRMISLSLYREKAENIFYKFAKFFVEKTDFIFKKFDEKINFSIGSIKLNYIMLILLLMLLQKLILLLVKNN